MFAVDYLKKSGEYIIQLARNALKMSLEIKTRAANLLSDLSFHSELFDTCHVSYCLIFA